MEARLETITPKKAQELLKLNTYNRPVNQKHVDFLAGQMQVGNWRVTGDTIKLNGTVLVDGQHRLYAVIKSGATIQSYIVRGVDANAYNFIDIIKPRSVGDHFGRAKEDHYNTLAAACRWIYCYLHDGNFRLTQTPEDAQKTLDAHPMLRDSVHFLRSFRMRGMIGYGAASGMHCKMAERDSSVANEFWTRVAGGEGLTKSMPEYVFRARLIENSNGHRQVRPYVLQAMGIKAWNLRRANKPCKLLRWTDDESFPTIE